MLTFLFSFLPVVLFFSFFFNRHMQFVAACHALRVFVQQIPRKKVVKKLMTSRFFVFCLSAFFSRFCRKMPFVHSLLPRFVCFCATNSDQIWKRMMSRAPVDRRNPSLGPSTAVLAIFPVSTTYRGNRAQNARKRKRKWRNTHETY